MYKLQFLAIFALVGCVISAPSRSFKMQVKRYVGGACGMHANQTQRIDNDDDWSMEIFDADGNSIGGANGGVSDATPVYCRGELPYEIECTQPADSHDVTCCYQTPAPYCFGTLGGCSVGAWADNYVNGLSTRQMDCGFNC